MHAQTKLCKNMSQNNGNLAKQPHPPAIITYHRDDQGYILLVDCWVLVPSTRDKTSPSSFNLMRHVVGPRRLPTASETNVRRQNGNTPTSSTRESVASTEAPSPPTYLFCAETVITNQPIPSDDGQHPPAAFHFATAAASRHAHAKRTSRTPATAQPRLFLSNASHVTSDGKRQKTASAREDPCCPCSILSTCSKRNSPCAKARRPCQNCDSSRGRCSNTVAAHYAVICEANRNNLPHSTLARFHARMGLLPRPLIPLIVEPAECTEDDNELATTASPTTQRHISPSASIMRLISPVCFISSKLVSGSRSNVTPRKPAVSSSCSRSTPNSRNCIAESLIATVSLLQKIRSSTWTTQITFSPTKRQG